MSTSREVLPRVVGAILLCASSSPYVAAGPIAGAWYLNNAGQAQSTAVFAILSDGRFMFVEDGDSTADPSGQDGLEKGTYTWNSSIGAFAINTVINTNGEWGLCNVPSGSTLCGLPSGTTASASESALALTVPGEGAFSLPRLADPALPIVGAWYTSAGPAAQDLTVVAFLPNGKFMVGIDPPATAYIEFGDYTWNPLTGAFSAIVNASNAPPGSSFGLDSFSSAEILNSRLLLSAASDSRTLTAVAVPEPATFALMAAGLILLRTMRRRRDVSSVRRLWR